MPSLGVSSLDFDRVGKTMRSFFALKQWLLLGCQRQVEEVMAGHCHQLGREPRKIVGQRIEAGRFLKRPLVHIEAAVDFDLQRMEATRWPPVMFGDEATGIG